MKSPPLPPPPTTGSRGKIVPPQGGSGTAPSSLSPKARASLTVPGTFATYGERAAFVAEAAIRLLMAVTSGPVANSLYGRPEGETIAAVVLAAGQIFDQAYALPKSTEPSA